MDKPDPAIAQRSAGLIPAGTGVPSVGDAAGSIVAVIVTYEPEPESLRRTLLALGSQVRALVLVDNGSRRDPCRDLAGQVPCDSACIRLGDNLGIAAAQNRGIDWARARGADYVLLSDQDSEPAADMVAQLAAVAERLARDGAPVALLAPDYVDERQSVQIPFMHIVDDRAQWFGCGQSDTVQEITTAIASGSLIPMATLNRVGPMREAMFIDLVDIEWCFRARARGYRAFGVCAAALRHSLGDRPSQVLGRALATHSPLRNYYFYRNALWLFQQDYVPAVWKRAVAFQMLKRLLVFPLAVRPRWDYFKMMMLGIWHGLRGRSGAL